MPLDVEDVLCLSCWEVEPRSHRVDGQCANDHAVREMAPGPGFAADRGPDTKLDRGWLEPKLLSPHFQVVPCAQ